MIGVDFKIVRVDFDVDFLGLWHDQNGRDGGVDTSSGLSLRNALNAVSARFKLKFGIDVFALNHKGNVGISARSAKRGV